MHRAFLSFSLVLCNATLSFAQDVLKPGTVELYPTWSAVGLELSYTGDDNGNAQASFVWRKQGDANWRSGVDMTFDRKLRLIWASIWPLEQGDKVEVKISLTDPDGGAAELAATTTVKTLLLEPKGGAAFFVSPQGDDTHPGSNDKPFKTLAHAAMMAKAGDIVNVRSGVYAEGELFQRLKGIEGKPIVFQAAPGEKPIIDSSLVLDKDAQRWRDAGGGLFVTDVEMFYSDSGGYVAQDGLRMFRYEILADLKADKLKVQRAWFYDVKAKQLYVRTGTGKSPGEHRYNLARHAIGIHLTGSQHVVVRGFTVRHFGAALVRLSEGARGCILYENELHNGPGGIFMKSEATRDNAIWKNDIHEPGMLDFSWNAHYALGYPFQAIYSDKAGRGNSFCYNRVHDHFDLISVESWQNPNNLALHRDCDIMFNELWNAGDDAIEVDGGGVNMRIHGNSMRNCFSAISLAPIERGPVYVTRNHASFFNLFIKFNVGGVAAHGWAYIYHNTGYCLLTGDDGGTGISFSPTGKTTNKSIKNNIIIVNEWSIRAGQPGCTFDGNCYYHVPGRPPRRFQWNKAVYAKLADFRSATGQEKNGLYEDPKLTAIPDAGKLQAPSNLGDLPPSGWGLTRDWKAIDLRLRNDSPCMDRGVPIRGINEDFAGKAPDMGAFERR